MRIMHIQVRCPAAAQETAHQCQSDLCLAVESVVSVALLELFATVEVEEIRIEDESHEASDDSYDYPQL